MLSVAQRVARKLFFSAPVVSRHSELSLLFFKEADDSSNPTRALIDFALASVRKAQDCDLSDIAARIPAERNLIEIWPGEHYKLLAGIVSVLQPRLVIEIGTATGSSALTLKKLLPSEGRIVTFDIIPWKEYPGTCLRDSDFVNGTLEQRVEDLSLPAVLERNRTLLERAELIFVDGAKDGLQERQFLDGFKRVQFERPPLLVFDDIRLWNMLKIWQEVDRPKLDLTSFGHWSGTGLVQWK